MATQNRSGVTDTALVAVFAALIAALTLAPAIPVGAIGVPITLQTLAVTLAAMVLGPWRGALAVLLYLAVGLAGLPVFAQGTAGLGVLARPSVGYLLGFLPAALVIGWLSRLVLRRFTLPAARAAGLVGAGLVGALAAIYPAGTAGLHLVAQLPWGAAVAANLPFLPGDVAKIVVAALVALSVHRAFPDLLARPAGGRHSAPEPVRPG